MVNVIKAGFVIENCDGPGILALIERAGRTAYRSEDKISEGSSVEFARKILALGHESVLEHGSISVRFIVDRGVSHEIVRHRIMSYTQESTRYCNYAGTKFGSEITVIDARPHLRDGMRGLWMSAMEHAEHIYLLMLADGVKPQIARDVLPNSLKTELVATGNVREWRHFFRLRTSKAAHPQMREVTVPLLGELKALVPVVFDDITLEGAA